MYAKVAWEPSQNYTHFMPETHESSGLQPSVRLNPPPYISMFLMWMKVFVYAFSTANRHRLDHGHFAAPIMIT
jgi:hypothetical protein